MTRLGWVVLAVGLPALIVTAAVGPSHARSAADQDWPPFVLVSGLLLIGTVAGQDGVFSAAGFLVARVARRGISLMAASAVLVAVVAAVLNLDTAVVFLTPVLIAAARRRHLDEAPFVYLTIFLANGASLLLPGSNLTNLIVIEDRHLSGSAFAVTMLPAWIASCVAIALVVTAVFRHSLGAAADDGSHFIRPRIGAGLVGIGVAIVAVVALPSGPSAWVVLGAGVAVAGWDLVATRLTWRGVHHAVRLPLLAGLFGLAVSLGALGRVWSVPHRVLAHASSWETAAIGAQVAVVFNNLPAASLLASRPVPNPFALLVGLNLGPNLVLTGGLAALLWWQVARAFGARPSVARFTRLGAVAVPISMAAAVAALALFH
ncbi:MAG: ArsB/NhaD family transporter [Actinomycetota bacterium]|jgi:arsenical pump membrane protein|nr:ArsB/NhaD family transporter [Actinomycetota bacterium]